MRFIELSNAETGKHVFINVPNILTIERVNSLENGEVTLVNMIDEFIEVTETPDEIMIKIRG